MSKNSKDKYDEFLIFVILNQTRDALQRLRKKELEPFNISPVEGAFLSLIGDRSPGPAPVDLSHWVFRESQSVSGLLNRMQKKGLLKRVKDRERINGIRVELTRKGLKLHSKLVICQDVRRTIRSTFSYNELNLLESLLRRLRNRTLQKIGKGKGVLPAPEPIMPLRYTNNIKKNS